MQHSEGPEWLKQLDALLTGRYPEGADRWEHGAQIRVPGTQHPAPLARHHRVEPGDPPTLWVRPIRGHYQEEDGTDAYDLDLARRRALHYTSARVAGDGAVELETTEGARVRIEPAGPEAMAEIARWDAFTLEVLPADTEAELDSLETD
ncbi:hypothetical protein KDK95_31565 [Actinospica sp. MGRD01-02]|uniref:Uncharacterized protein n=1 Tax=Actinospica acidithermotolerans TaxID=2828514 RepID=A0A941EDU2_9ACTN|nr:hypothetical protein [Actinospica acidithermotolerans]MBR7830885.1 hypothetical protein [Actinospica acidithermotolerans]